VIAALPRVWERLHDYQRERVLTFIDPERDPLGSGYHILQSKIAIGSGGVAGKGFMHGTQAQLNFLPEKHTDFIFTMFAEEFGMVGGIVLLGLFVLVLFYGFAIALRSRNHFGRMLALGISITIFLYLFINIGMVMGVLPVVGVPLPLVSYGGTAMLSVLAGCGLLISAYVHRDVVITRSGGAP
jgi:rod shape determining protein RodA